MPAPAQADPLPLPYLRQLDGERTNYDVQLEVSIVPEGQGRASDSGGASGTRQARGGVPQPTLATRSNMRTMYWTLPQVGCEVDLLASHCRIIGTA